MKVHLFVISWKGKHDDAERIAAACEAADVRTVIYSNAEEQEESGTGEWISVPNEYFFGRKFARALEAFRGDIFLLVQADAVYADWNGLLEACRAAHAHETVGVWAPHVHHSWWTNERVVMGLGPVGSIVAQTDGIVFSFRASIAERLRRYDYAVNNLGWGVEWAAIVAAAVEGRFAYRDQRFRVHHPEGSGYNHTEARKQQAAFLAQMTETERPHFRRLLSFCVRPQGADHGAP